MTTERERIENQIKLLDAIEQSAQRQFTQARKLLANTRRVRRKLFVELKKLEGKNERN